MNERLTVSASPHVRSHTTTRGIMLDVIIALLPAGIVSVIYYGYRALLLILVSVLFSVLFEYLARKIMKRKNTVGDLSAVVTGLLIAYNVPSTLPLWVVIIGDLIAIVIVKQMFGGIGQNFVNPAITARIVLMTSFPVYMTSFVLPFAGADAVTSATPLATLNGLTGADNVSSALAASAVPKLSDLFLGLHGGSLGEVCALALILGFIYLLIRKVITPVIPACFIGTVAVIMLIAGKGSFSFMLAQILSGGLLLGAFFMATDYTTSPINTKGKVVFGIGCGILTCLIRLFGSLAEGVSFSIILMNILVPHIERLTRSKPFGTVDPKKEAAR